MRILERMPSIPALIAAVVDEELAQAKVRIFSRLDALFGGALAPSAQGLQPPPPVAPQAPGVATGGRRHRSKASELEALHGAVLGAFASGEELTAADVRKRTRIVDRHQVSRALRALVKARKLRQKGTRGGAAYTRR